MTLKILTPNLMVEDVNRTVEFYKSPLGFELIGTKPETGQFDWAMMKCGNVEIMFQSRASLAAELPAFKELKVGGALTFYIVMAGVEELYAKLRGKVTLVQDLHTAFYGMREFSIRDYNGFILTFAERV